MSSLQFQAIYPLLVLAAGAVIIMLQVSLRRGLRLTAGVTVAALLVAAASAIPAASYAPQLVTPLLQADRLALLFSAVFCIAGAATALLSLDYLQQRGDEPEEFFLLLLLSTMGACVLAYATHVASLLLGMELLSIALYALIAYPDKTVLPLEAATKYLVLSGAATATTLFGFALLYAATGSLSFAAMGQTLQATNVGTGMILVAAAMVVAGLGFKLSLVPFHLWTPDVYVGAPAPVTGFLAAVSKAAMFIALLRLFLEADLLRYPILIECIGVMAILSMLGGNLLALLQTNIKRMLAYSSIAHMGYLLIIVIVAVSKDQRAFALEAASFYLIAYAITTLAAFGLLTYLSVHSDDRENVELHHISGLLWYNPLYACMMLVALLSLAGIPLTAGFIAKFYLFGAAVSGSHWILLGSLIAGSGIGIYYYLRVVFYMTRRPDEQHYDLTLPQSSLARLVSWCLIAGVILLGTLPQPLMSYLRSIL